MRNSLKDQMLQLGLVNKQKHGEAKRQEHKRKKDKGLADEIAAMNAELTQKAQETRKAKAQAHNRQREEKLKQRENQARIRQLVESNRLAKNDAGKPYRFNYLGKIHRVIVDDQTAARLAKGVCGIVCLDEAFELIPREVAEKIQELDPRFFVMLNERISAGEEDDPDDPYADYKVPDDLIW